MLEFIARRAAAFCAFRAASLSDDAVAEARRRIAERWRLQQQLQQRQGEQQGGKPPLAAGLLLARALRPGSGDRRAALVSLMAARPGLLDAAERWCRANLPPAVHYAYADASAHAAPTLAWMVPAGAVTPEYLISRHAMVLAAAELRAGPLAEALGHAADNAIVALKEATRFGPSRGAPEAAAAAPSNAGAGGAARRGGGAAATARDKALYAAVRCVGRWGELRAEHAAAEAELAAAQTRLREARCAAERAAAYASQVPQLRPKQRQREEAAGGRA